MALIHSLTPAKTKPALSQKPRFIRPDLPHLDSVIAQYRDIYASGIITNAAAVEKFEACAAEKLQVKHCVAVSSCTSGLALTLRALGITGEVIVPSFTFFATGHAILWNQATPVFADCDPSTWTVDPEDVERQITENTSAIVAVHMYGNPCNVDSLTRIAQKHGLKLIFDAAHAFGSQYNGSPIGSFGDAEVFSLSPTKLLVAGEGGIVATNDAVLARILRAMRNYGDVGHYDPEWLGLNARMTEFNAVLGTAGIPDIDRKVRRRNEIAQHYTSILADVPGLSFQDVLPGNVNTFKDYSVVVQPGFPMSRDELALVLLEENIETKKYFYPPLHQQTLYSKYYNPDRDCLEDTERISGGVLSLPIYELLADDVVEEIGRAVKRVAADYASLENGGELKSYAACSE